MNLDLDYEFSAKEVLMKYKEMVNYCRENPEINETTRLYELTDIHGETYIVGGELIEALMRAYANKYTTQYDEVQDETEIIYVDSQSDTKWYFENKGTSYDWYSITGKERVYELYSEFMISEALFPLGVFKTPKELQQSTNDEETKSTNTYSYEHLQSIITQYEGVYATIINATLENIQTYLSQPRTRILMYIHDEEYSTKYGQNTQGIILEKIIENYDYNALIQYQLIDEQGNNPTYAPTLEKGTEIDPHKTELWSTLLEKYNSPTRKLYSGKEMLLLTLNKVYDDMNSTRIELNNYKYHTTDEISITPHVYEHLSGQEEELFAGMITLTIDTLPTTLETTTKIQPQSKITTNSTNTIQVIVTDEYGNDAIGDVTLTIEEQTDEEPQQTTTTDKLSTNLNDEDTNEYLEPEKTIPEATYDDEYVEEKMEYN